MKLNMKLVFRLVVEAGYVNISRVSKTESPLRPLGYFFRIISMHRAKAKYPNSLRVIAGQWRSRKLTFPDVEGLRPTANRVRETLFNWLQDRIVREDCLDLFAGSGACGIEALSRGARRVSFVDLSPVAMQALKMNLSLLQADNYELFCDDALRWLENHRGCQQTPYGLVFIDPPFATDLLQRSSMALEQSGLMRADALIYLETSRALASDHLPLNWRRIKTGRAGNVNFYLYERASVVAEHQAVMQ
jgi:16S rRNA (guanine966-N2)-methyltransferase